MFEVENKSKRAITVALEGAGVDITPGQTGSDLIARGIDGTEFHFQVKWAGLGWPQQVKRAAAEVQESWPNHVIIAAQHFSPGAIDWMRDRGANWADETGQARILGPNGLIVIKEPAQSLRKHGEARAFKWSKSAISIAEVILGSEDRPLRTAELSERSDWSMAQVANVLQAFDKQSWTRKMGASRGPNAHRKLVDAEGMLSSWSDELSIRPRETRFAHRTTRDLTTFLIDEFAPILNRSTEKWAISGWVASELVAPFASSTPMLHIYVSDSDFFAPLDLALGEAGLREVDEGGRVVIWAGDPRTFRQSHRVQGVPVVSSPRLFSDLNSFGARGHDAALHVKEELIDPLHPDQMRGQGA